MGNKRQIKGGTYKKAEQGYSLLTPWEDPTFRALYAQASPYTIVSVDRCYNLYKFCAYACNLDGHVAELGVYKGGVSYLLASAIEDMGRDKQLHLFDTFSGMPEEANSDPSPQYFGQFGDTSLGKVQDVLRRFTFVEYHLGHIPGTLSAVVASMFCFVHFDLDTYIATRQALEKMYDRTVPGGVFIFDEYGFDCYQKAEKQAVDEFFCNKPEEVICLASGQGLVMKV